jgi:Fe-S cluster biogenesis protein NfuA
LNVVKIGEEVQRVLDSEIRPLLQFHGGDVRVVGITPQGTVHLEYFGACHGCYLQVVTHFVSVRPQLLKVEGVSEIVTLGVNPSESSKRRIEEVYRGLHPLFGTRSA